MSENFINFSEIRDLRTAFDLLDRDQDGHVTPEELQFMLRNLGIHVRDELIDDLLREASRTAEDKVDMLISTSKTSVNSVSISELSSDVRCSYDHNYCREEQLHNSTIFHDHPQKSNSVSKSTKDSTDDADDTNHSQRGSGLIDETEFLQWVARIQALKEESNSSSSGSSSSTTQAADDDLTQDLVAAFRVFDRDGNGYITRDELKSAMDMIGENVTEYQLNEMLELADADKDGRINYEEFARLLL